MSETLNEYVDRLERGAGKTMVIQLYRRALDNPKSLAFATHARCVQCSHGTDNEGWVDRVRYCRPRRCALHAVRPYQDSTGEKLSRRKAISAYCWDCMGGQEGGRSGANGNVRKLIHECTIESCFIHNFRPYQDWRQTVDVESGVTGALPAACCPSGAESAAQTIEEQGAELSTA